MNSIVKESSSLYILTLVPIQPGYLSISLSRSIQSQNGKTLMSPPTLEFNYIGTQIVSVRVSGLTHSSVSVSITTSKVTQLWSLIVPSHTMSVPSEKTIMSNGQFSGSSTNHILYHTDLVENTEYIVYFTGMETSGTLLGNDIAGTKITVKTRDLSDEDVSSKSDGTICESGWGQSRTTDKLELLPCSNHGYCQQSKCMYIHVSLLSIDVLVITAVRIATKWKKMD